MAFSISFTAYTVLTTNNNGIVPVIYIEIKRMFTKKKYVDQCNSRVEIVICGPCSGGTKGVRGLNPLRGFFCFSVYENSRGLGP